LDTMLEMVFKTGMGRQFRLTLDNPRLDLTPAEVEDAMNLIIEKDLFAVEGGVTEVDSAQIITTQIETIVVG
jgi:hypothetical protein